MKNSNLFNRQSFQTKPDGKFLNARKLFARAKQCAEFDDRKEVALQACFNMADCYMTWQKFHEAEKGFKRFLQMLDGLEEAHPDEYAHACINLAIIQRMQSKNPKAGIRILEAAVKKMELFAEQKSVGLKHLFGLLGLIKADVGHCSEAESLLRRALDMSLNSIGPKDDSHEMFMDMLVILLLKQTRVLDAMAAFEMYCGKDVPAGLQEVRTRMERMDLAGYRSS